MAINFPDSPTSGDTHTVGDKTWTWNGTSWDVVVSTPISNQIIDADGDTRIHVEESPDEDYIRFDTAGTERMTIGPTGDVAVANDLSVTGTISGGSTSFPTSLDSGTMPAIEALQAKVGVDSSAVTSSLDYKVAQLQAGLTAIPAGIGSNVVYATTTTSTTTSSTSYVDTALSATITPTSASSKVLFMVSANYLNGPNSITRPGYSIARGNAATGTVLSSGAYGFAQVYQTQDIPHQINVAFMGVDSPATTSPQTYTVIIRTNQSAVSVSGDQNLTLIEVAG